MLIKIINLLIKILLHASVIFITLIIIYYRYVLIENLVISVENFPENFCTITFQK